MAEVTEDSVREWFDFAEKYLKQGWKARGCPGLLDDPSRIFNCDESGFALDGGTGRRNKVVVVQGAGPAVPTVKVAPGTKRQVPKFEFFS